MEGKEKSMHRYVIFTLAVTTLLCPSWSRASTWDIDPNHTSAQFAIRHLMVSTVRGDFGKVSGVVNLDENDLTKSSVEATIDAASLNTRVADRDKHLKSAEFFDVEKYPTITFKSKRVEKTGEAKFKVTGDLTLRGITKEVVLDVEGTPTPFKDPRGITRMGGMASTKINRKDFGIQWSRALETGGMVVGDEVSVTIDIELTQRTATAAQ
jgi:polyisoprenoid-binding protein YceI